MNEYRFRTKRAPNISKKQLLLEIATDLRVVPIDRTGREVMQTIRQSRRKILSSEYSCEGAKLRSNISEYKCKSFKEETRRDFPSFSANPVIL
jgi:hypothetical protein